MENSLKSVVIRLRIKIAPTTFFDIYIFYFTIYIVK